MDLIASQDVTAFLVLEKVSRKTVPWGEVSVRYSRISREGVEEFLPAVSLVTRQGGQYDTERITVMWKLIRFSSQNRETGSALKPIWGLKLKGDGRS